MAGRYFEAFELGQAFIHEIRRIETHMGNILFSALTYNPAAIHIDNEYAKMTEFGKPLFNSIVKLRLVVGCPLGYDAGNDRRQSWLGGSRLLKAGVRRRHEPRRNKNIALRESKSRPSQGVVTFERKGLNQRDGVVCMCRRVALMLRKPI